MLIFPPGLLISALDAVSDLGGSGGADLDCSDADEPKEAGRSVAGGLDADAAGIDLDSDLEIAPLPFCMLGRNPARGRLVEDDGAPTALAIHAYIDLLGAGPRGRIGDVLNLATSAEHESSVCRQADDRQEERQHDRSPGDRLATLGCPKDTRW